MAAKSAKSGTITWDAGALANVHDIQVSDTSETQVYASSSTSGAKSRVAGLDDVTGSFKLYEDPGFSKGDSGTLVVTTDGTEELFNATAIIEDIQVSAPVGSGGLVEWSVTWGAKPV